LPGAVNLLPTPAASNPNDGEDLNSWEERRQKNLAKGINGNGQGTPLSIALRLYPTPTATDGKNAGYRKGPSPGKNYLTLAGATGSAHTAPLSHDGNASDDDKHQIPLWTDD
jgi:hypothetical protein